MISPSDFHNIEIKIGNLDYRFIVDGDTLYIKHLYGFSSSQNIKYTIRNLLKAEMQPDEITDELYLGALDGEYKFVRKNGQYYFLHHYVKRFMPELYDKYKLLGDGKYDIMEPRVRPIYIKE